MQFILTDLQKEIKENEKRKKKASGPDKLVLIIIFPQIALWLPTLLYGQ